MALQKLENHDFEENVDSLRAELQILLDQKGTAELMSLIGLYGVLEADFENFVSGRVDAGDTAVQHIRDKARPVIESRRQEAAVKAEKAEEAMLEEAGRKIIERSKSLQHKVVDVALAQNPEQKKKKNTGKHNYILNAKRRNKLIIENKVEYKKAEERFKEADNYREFIKSRKTMIFLSSEGKNEGYIKDDPIWLYSSLWSRKNIIPTIENAIELEEKLRLEPYDTERYYSFLMEAKDGKPKGYSPYSYKRDLVFNLAQRWNEEGALEEVRSAIMEGLAVEDKISDIMTGSEKVNIDELNKIYPARSVFALKSKYEKARIKAKEEWRVKANTAQENGDLKEFLPAVVRWLYFDNQPPMVNFWKDVNKNRPKTDKKYNKGTSKALRDNQTFVHKYTIDGVIKALDNKYEGEDIIKYKDSDIAFFKQKITENNEEIKKKRGNRVGTKTVKEPRPRNLSRADADAAGDWRQFMINWIDWAYFGQENPRDAFVGDVNKVRENYGKDELGKWRNFKDTVYTKNPKKLKPVTVKIVFEAVKSFYEKENILAEDKKFMNDDLDRVLKFTGRTIKDFEEFDKIQEKAEKFGKDIKKYVNDKFEDHQEFVDAIAAELKKIPKKKSEEQGASIHKRRASYWVNGFHIPKDTRTLTAMAGALEKDPKTFIKERFKEDREQASKLAKELRGALSESKEFKTSIRIYKQLLGDDAKEFFSEFGNDSLRHWIAGDNVPPGERAVKLVNGLNAKGESAEFLYKQMVNDRQKKEYFPKYIRELQGALLESFKEKGLPGRMVLSTIADALEAGGVKRKDFYSEISAIKSPSKDIIKTGRNGNWSSSIDTKTTKHMAIY